PWPAQKASGSAPRYCLPRERSHQYHRYGRRIAPPQPKIRVDSMTVSRRQTFLVASKLSARSTTLNDLRCGLTRHSARRHRHDLGHFPEEPGWIHHEGEPSFVKKHSSKPRPFVASEMSWQRNTLGRFHFCEAEHLFNSHSCVGSTVRI